KPSYLTVSGQLNGEIFACGLGKIYTFGPTFRAENSNTSRHLAECWMVEPEMAFYELTDNMTLAEAFLKRVVRDVLDQCGDDMQFFNDRIDKNVLTTAEGMANSEIIGGSQREERLDVLQLRMAEQHLNAEDYWWYIDLRRYGTVPHSGFGLGLERVLLFLTGMANIRDVIPFPRTPGNADF